METNSIWTCSDEWIEEWGNPGNIAPHHIARRLGIVPSPDPDTRVTMETAVTILLHHLGSSCSHVTGAEQRIADVTETYLNQLSDILRSVRGNSQQLRCVLILLNKSMQSVGEETTLGESIGRLRQQVYANSGLAGVYNRISSLLLYALISTNLERSLAQS